MPSGCADDHDPLSAHHCAPSAVVELGGAATAAAHFEEICRIYEDVFSRPPFAWDEHEGQRQRESLRHLMADPSFAVAVASAGQDTVGFAYGIRVPPDTRRWQGFVTPVPEEVTAEWEGRTFAVVDMAVRQQWRGRGLGRRLLETLVGSRDEERATLTVEPAAEATKAFYQHLGWRRVGRKRTGEGFFIPFFDVYVLPLAGKAKP